MFNNCGCNLRTHAMNNPVILGTVHRMAGEMCCPNPCENSCGQNTCGQNNQNSCYSTQLDLERAQFREEFEQGYHRGIRKCQRCQDIKSLRNLPHCCGCKCEYYKRMAMIDRDYCCKTGTSNSRNERPTPCRTTDHGQFCDRNNVFLCDPCVQDINDNQNCVEPVTYYCGTCNNGNQCYDPCCGQNKSKFAPFRPRQLPKGPISTYRADYMPPKCKGPRYLDPDDSRNPINSRPPWDWRTRTDTFPYDCCQTIAATEAKLKALDDMIYKVKLEQPQQPLFTKSVDSSET